MEEELNYLSDLAMTQEFHVDELMEDETVINHEKYKLELINNIINYITIKELTNKD